MDEKSPIVSGRSSSNTEDSQAIYHGEGQSRSQVSHELYLLS